jgi:hypothetical protein
MIGKYGARREKPGRKKEKQVGEEGKRFLKIRFTKNGSQEKYV